MNTRATPDFDLAEHGSIVILRPITPAATDWTTDHLPADCPRWLDGYAIGTSFICNILRGLADAGLSFEVAS